MRKLPNLIKFFLIILDFFLFFLSLVFVLFLRYGNDFLLEFGNHFFAFFVLSFFAILILFSFSWYDFYLINLKNIFIKILNFFIVFLIFGAFYFYFSQVFFSISPKTNFLLFNLIFCFMLILIRIVLLRLIRKKPIFVYFLGEDKLKIKLEEDLKSTSFFAFKGIFDEKKAEDRLFLVISPNYHLGYHFIDYFKKSEKNFAIFDFISFYEKFFGRIPLEALSTEIIIKDFISSEIKIYSFIKRSLDFLIALIVFVFIFLPLFPLISFLIYINSPGPIFFIQERIGYHGKLFKLIKFRTMHMSNDYGNKWAVGEESHRIFLVGKILRKTHLDELPQIFNIIKGEISFVGPRPEQPLISAQLEKEINYYDLRYLVLPGITGWAQVNYKYPENIDETKIKLEYDLYYLKNSSIFLDFLIIIKTIQKLIF